MKRQWCDLCAARGTQTLATHYFRIGDPIDLDFIAVWVVCAPCRETVKAQWVNRGTVPEELMPQRSARGRER